MKSSSLIIKLLLVAMALATAWAVRGQFGHEHGAAWAGGIGVLAVLAVSNRADWYRKLPVIVALGAIGWGVGGMMSYGVVVGYGKSLEFINVIYGLLSLLLIGGLYGFIGGGMAGLSIASTTAKKVDWAALIAQMVAGAYLIWGILIYQFEWLMTPPRSELWAACLGAALALGWYAYRNQYYAALRVALFSGLGAGFGFAFGNFLQVMGTTSGIVFNWWNVMEYSLGFFGGLGMAYGILSEDWEESSAPDRLTNYIGWIFLVLFLPLTNIIQAFSCDKLLGRAEDLGLTDPQALISLQYILIWGSLIVFGVFFIWHFKKQINNSKAWTPKDALLMLALYLAWYIFLSNVMGANWLRGGDLKEYLYWANLIIIIIGIGYKNIDWQVTRHATFSQWFRLGAVVMLILIMLSFIMINAHHEMPGAKSRFVSSE